MKTKLSVVQLVCISTAIYPTTVFVNIRTGPYKIVTICSTKQLIFSTLKTQNYNPIKTHQPLSNTTQQHVQTADLEHVYLPTMLTSTNSERYSFFNLVKSFLVQYN